MSARDRATARDHALRYLEGHNVVTLATDGPQGLWAAAVFYVHDGFTLYFLSSPATRHARNILARSNVSATVQEDYANWQSIRGIQLEGDAERIEGAEREDAIRRYGEKFPVVVDPEHQVARAISKVAWFRLVPRRLYFIDNSLGLGHRDEIPLEDEP